MEVTRYGWTPDTFTLEKGMNTIDFTPTETETVGWSCRMGMIPGAFIVTNDRVASDTN